MEYIGFEVEDKSSIWQWEGFEICTILDNIIALITLIVVFFLLISFSLEIVFSQLKESRFLDIVQVISLLFFIIEMAYNSVTVKSQAGRRLRTLEDILENYLHTNLVIDVINVLILFMDLNIDSQVIVFLRLFIVTKLPQCLEKMEKLELKEHPNQ